MCTKLDVRVSINLRRAVNNAGKMDERAGRADELQKEKLSAWEKIIFVSQPNGPVQALRR